MEIAPGVRLGPYEVTAVLGHGGMGRVFRARDTRLDRDVAVKVLAEVSAGPDSIRRFEQEARAASSLNHPHIISVYDIGTADGAPYIVMELVDGRTLRDLLDAGPIPLKKTLQISTQIADGLAKAHAAGIVHRDLKPENVMVSRDGFVKILDFGLAKLTSLSNANSIVTMAPVTGPGTILGTVGYMSPEQARGMESDYRGDQFSFGAILYEMLTGRRAFGATSSAQTLAAIIEREPEPLQTLAPMVSVPLVWVVERCLAKDPDDRYASTRDLTRDLQLLRDRSSEADTVARSDATIAPPARRSHVLPFAAAIVAASLVGGLVAFWMSRPAPAEPPILRPLTFSGADAMPAASPDGRTVAYVSNRDGRSRVWLKQLPSGDEIAITAGPDLAPRFSPDGGSVLFVRDATRVRGFYLARGALYRVPIVGGEPRKLLDDASGGEWSPDGGRLAFLRTRTGGDVPSVLVGVAAADGTNPRIVREIKSAFGVGPRWTPDGRHVVISTLPFGVVGPDEGRLVMVPIDGGEPRRIDPGIAGGDVSLPVWIDNDTAVYAQAESVSAAGLAVGSISRIVLHPLRTGARNLFWTPAMVLHLDIVGPGKLVLDSIVTTQSLRQQSVEPGRVSEHWITSGASSDRQPVYSPDGKWILFASTRGGNLDLWAISTDSGMLRRITDHPAEDWDPAYTPDGQGILWSSNRTGHFEIWTAAPDGSGARQVSNDGVDAENPTSTPDGVVVYNSGDPAKTGLWKMRLDGGSATQLLEGFCAFPDVSANGEYALCTAAMPQQHVKVVRLADGAVMPYPVRVSESGVGRARWMPDGRTIAYLDQTATGKQGVFLQDFVAGTDTSSTRREVVGTASEGDVETFGVSRDGRIILSIPRLSSSIMLLEGLKEIARTRRP